MDQSFTYRSTCPQDFEEICQLSQGIYGDIDYFSHVFHDLLASPIWHLYVAIGKERKIVASTAMLITNKETTLVWRFSRVMPSYRGQKLIKKLKSFALQDVKFVKSTPFQYQIGLYPNDTIKSTPNIIPNPSKLALFEICAFVVNIEIAKELFSNNNVDDTGLIELSLQDFKRAGKDTKGFHSLLPSNILALDSDIFTMTKISEDEHQYLQMRQLGLLLSNKSTNPCITELYDEFTISEDTEPDARMALSAIYWKPCRFNSNGWGIVMNMYVCNSKDILLHLSYVICKLLKIFHSEDRLVLKVGFFQERRRDDMKCSEEVAEWANTMHPNWFTTSWASDFFLVKSECV